MSTTTERCPACNGLTYYVDQTGAHKCDECDGTGMKRPCWPYVPSADERVFPEWGPVVRR